MEHAKKYVLMDPAMYSRVQTPQIAASPPAHAAPMSHLDSEVRDILEGNEPDDVKAKHYAMVLKKFRVREPVKYEEATVDEIEILESVPATARHKAKRLVRIVKENPRLTWNERGELIHKQTTISGSSIVELFNDILKPKRAGDERPLGWREFAEGLGESREISKDLVPNYDSWKVISRNKRPEPAVVPTPPTVRVDRPEKVDRRQRPRERLNVERRRIIGPDRTPARRSLSWEDY